MDCSDGECGRPQYAEGFCHLHWLSWNKSQLCSEGDCARLRKGTQDVCESHYRKRLAEKNRTLKPCGYPGCCKPSVARGLCDAHRKREDTNGTLESLRPPDWGMKEKHPLINSYRWISKRTKEGVTEEWDDFWRFVEDVGERPEGHTLRRYDSSKPFGPGNWYWKDSTPNTGRASYMREWNKRNPLKAKNNDLRKMYGIGLVEYDSMLSDQNGVCAICSEPETGRFKYLAVDHDHDTGKIRGLLCHRCNKALGGFKDSAEMLGKAVKYLENRN